MASELILQQSEVLVFLDALGINRLPGVETNRLVPVNPELRRSLLLDGIASLIEKEILVKQDGTHILPRNLLDLFSFLSKPGVMAICHKDTPGLGAQIFLLYFGSGRCIQLTFPTETTYRFEELPSAEAVVLRLLELFPLNSEMLPAEGIRLSMSDFNRFLDMVEEKSQPGIAELIDHAVLAAELARTGLMDSFRRPRFSGKLTVLKMNGSEAVDAKDFMCLQGRQTAWLFELDAADSSQIVIQPVTPEVCSQHFSSALGAMLQKG